MLANAVCQSTLAHLIQRIRQQAGSYRDRVRLWIGVKAFGRHGIICRLGSSQVLETVRRLKKFLISRHLHVILEDTVAGLHHESKGMPNLSM